MGWTIAPLQQGLQEHRDEWEAANARLNAGHPLLSVDFVMPLARHFGQSHDRLAVHRGASGADSLVALSAGRWRWQSFLPSQAQLSPTLLTDARHAASLLGSLPPTVAMLDLLCLDPMYAPDFVAADVARLEHSPHVTTLHVHIDGSFDAYWAARSKSLQQDLQNKWNRLKKDSLPTRLVLHEDPQAVAEALARYAQIEVKGWKAAQGTALQLGTVQGDFYADVLQRFAQRGQATVFELYIGDDLAASELVIRGGPVAVLLKTTHEGSFSRFAPGYLLDQSVLKHEFEARRVRHVEFYTAANSQKLRWGTAHRTIHHERLYRYAVAQNLVGWMRQRRAKASASAAPAESPNEA